MRALVKGVSRRVVVIKSPEGKFFEQAIFILKDDLSASGGRGSVDIVREACRIASSCTQGYDKQRLLKRIPPPVFAVLGAAAASAIWVLTLLF